MFPLLSTIDIISVTLVLDKTILSNFLADVNVNSSDVVVPDFAKTFFVTLYNVGLLPLSATISTFEVSNVLDVLKLNQFHFLILL